jgi:chemotaxis family two-component system response regulator Rcp1
MADARTIRLLVVEDSLPYLYLIRKAFSGRKGDARWEVTAAENGEQAIHLLFEEERDRIHLPDLILLDWNLPGMSGLQVLQRLKTHQNLRKIPVLVFSSSETDEDVHAAYGGHANGYIRKPEDENLLASIIETIEQFWVKVAQIPKVSR